MNNFSPYVADWNLSDDFGTTWRMNRAKGKIRNTVRMVILFIVLVVTDTVTGIAVAQNDNAAATPQTEAVRQQDTVTSGPLESIPSSSRDTDNGCKKMSPISTYKINYFTLNTWPAKENAQVKFQFSVKYKFLDRDFSLQGHPLALYFAYSQKSLWNVGQTSMPFEETNYNPEAFFDYHLNLSWGRFTLRDVILSPFEHESNGLAGPDSRSWNRQYAAIRLGYWPIEEQCETESGQKDHVELNVKAWYASGYSDEDNYLRTLGTTETFLDYEGYGELNLVLRDFIFQGDSGNRLDVTSRVGGKQNFEIQYQQKIPSINFSPYIQYWYGYDETLLRFNRFGKRTFIGVSFSY